MLVIKTSLTKPTTMGCCPRSYRHPYYSIFRAINQADVQKNSTYIVQSNLDVNVKVRYNSNVNTNLMALASPTAQPDSDQTLRIGELAARTNLTQRTIRYYEEVGLLAPATRTQGDYRLFSVRDVERLRKIIQLRDIFGFSLAEIRTTIDAEETIELLRTEYRATEDVAARIDKLDQARALTEGQLDLLDRKIAQIGELKAELQARLDKYSSKRSQLEAALNEQSVQDENVSAGGRE